MKKLITTLALTFLLFSCSSDTPQDVARKFSESMAKGEYEEAKEYATPATGKLLDMVALMPIPKEPNYKFEMIKDSIVENKAWVTIKKNDKEEAIELIKTDGKWLVSMGGK